MNPNTYHELETTINNRIHDNEKRDDYIFRGTWTKEDVACADADLTYTQKGNDYVITGILGCGIQIVFDLKLSSFEDYLKYKAEDSDYPTNDDVSMFAEPHPYDYLRTINIESLSLLKNEITKQVYETLIYDMQYQPRFGDPWRLMCGILHTLETARMVPRLLPIIMKVIFSYVTKPKFYFNQGRVIMNDDRCLSTLPSFLYSIQNLLIAYITNVLNETDFYLCLQSNIILLDGSYFDNKLKYKSAITNFRLEAIHNLNVVTSPMWNDDLTCTGIRYQRTTENELGIEQIKQYKIKRDETLPKFHLNVINHMLVNFTNLDQIIQFYCVSRYMWNCGEYLGTLTELGINKAVRPTTQGAAVPKPNVLYVIKAETDTELDGFPLITSYESLDDLNALKKDMNFSNLQSIGTLTEKYYFNGLVKPAVRRLRGTDMNYKWFNFATVKSAGRSFDEVATQTLSRRMAALAKTRIGYLAMNIANYNSPEPYYEDIATPIKLAERQQIGRRQRAIASTSNERLILALPGYVVEESLYHLTTGAVQGKQQGNVFDLAKLMRYSGENGTMINSIDIEGADSSIQFLFQEILTSFNLKVLHELSINKGISSNYAGFSALECKLQSMSGSDKGSTTDILLSGTVQAAIRDIKVYNRATTYVSKIFKTIKTQEGTFSSGRPDTGSHHTIAEDSLLTSQTMVKVLNGAKNTVYDKNLMGDDMIIINKGKNEDCVNDARDAAELLEKAGLKTTLETCMTSGVFLQQQATCGRYVGYADRISLATKERTNEHLVQDAKAKELMALVDDLSGRVNDHYHLHLLSFFLAAYTCRRVVFRGDEAKFNTLLTIFTENDVKFYSKSEESSDSGLISVLYPLSWLFCFKGGGLPAFRFERRDKSYTDYQHLSSARGYYLRRFLFDLSGFYTSDRDLSHGFDIQTFRDYRLDLSLRLVDVNVNKILNETKVSTFSEEVIYGLGSDSQEVFVPNETALSNDAAQVLHQNKVKVGRDILFGFSAGTRLLQVAESIRVDDSISERAIENYIKKLVNVNSKSNTSLIYEDDYKLMYTINYAPTGMFTMLPESRVVNTINISTSFRKYNLHWMLYHLLGGPSRFDAETFRSASIVRGKFQGFNYTDPVFKQGFDIYKNPRTKHLIEYYFLAVGVFNKLTQTQYLRIYDKLSRTHYYILDYDINPRRYFLINTSPVNCSRFIKSNNLTRSTVESRALLNTFVQLDILANPYKYSVGRLVAISLKESLLRKLESSVVSLQ